ncbi:unnamed protein product [Brassicogethes aeneus]|uniref:DUF4371 domain-containing protein n=1 Tax=Brassicogethes aeneus TaxID=1431903 RepID=A0A9P0AX80_BRAAE|nr:unnamed protein product [Brassicogethes aeneus]
MGKYAKYKKLYKADWESQTEFRASSLKEDLIEDIGDSPFSLILDESTDVSTIKYLCLCVRYFSQTRKKIDTYFLGIIPIDKATSDILAEEIKQYLNNIGLNLNKLIGLGTDGANNLCGKHHSVFTILKESVPQLQLVKCVAHSLHLCCCKSANVLPSAIDFLCKEIFNWFSNSALRRAAFKETFNLININGGSKFHNFIQLSDTRWLARANVLKVIIDQWVELRCHFNTIKVNEKTIWLEL